MLILSVKMFMCSDFKPCLVLELELGFNMKCFLILAFVVGVAVCEWHAIGSDQCLAILKVDCSSYPDEPVCVHDGRTPVTYMNSCEFAKGMCTYDGHSQHAMNEGVCS